MCGVYDSFDCHIKTACTSTKHDLLWNCVLSLECSTLWFYSVVCESPQQNKVSCQTSQLWMNSMNEKWIHSPTGNLWHSEVSGLWELGLFGEVLARSWRLFALSLWERRRDQHSLSKGFLLQDEKHDWQEWGKAPRLRAQLPVLRPNNDLRIRTGEQRSSVSPLLALMGMLCPGLINVYCR